MEARQLWEATSTATAQAAAVTGCRSISLPAKGVLSLANGETITLAADTLFKPVCSVLAQPAIIANGGVNIDQTSSQSDTQFSAGRDPFYASIFPQCYALASATIIAYTLVIMLVIAPRSFVDGGVVILGRRGHGFTNGGGSNGVTIGGRPWLQKVAALTVAVSLTIATVDTFRVAETQYYWGVQNAKDLQDEVLGGTQLKIIRLISDSFLWLAQAQTLIRLFPRQREKVIIKWTAFSLITLDIIFEGLNSFLYTGPNTRPANFTDAVPALNYLFQLSLGLLYAAWVIYYSLMKKQYAYYHPLMKNICLVAALSILSVLVPVVFFILDISKPEFTGWGDYVRWVGAAAASVVVWEWVERIEALEREVKKDGILGREVFDGDEMMEASPSEFSWPRRRKNNKKKDDDDSGESGQVTNDRGASSTGRIKMWPAMSSIASRYTSRTGSSPDRRPTKTAKASSTGRSGASRFLQPPLWPSRPVPAVTPISRTETTSADSTVYAVRYQPLTESASRSTVHRTERPRSASGSSDSSRDRTTSDADERPENAPPPRNGSPEPEAQAAEGDRKGWHGLSQLVGFRSRVHGPPAEVLPHTQRSTPPRRDYESSGRWDIKGRMEDFAATQAERIREKMRPTPDTENLPVTVIPAPPRRGAALAQLLEEEEEELAATNSSQAHIGASVVPTTLRAMRSNSNNSSAMPLSPLVIRSNSMASDSSRPMLSPARRHDTFQLRSARRDSLSSPTSPQRPGEDTENVPPRLVAGRRPVDDILQDDFTPSPRPG